MKMAAWKESYAPTSADPRFSPPDWFVVLMKRFGSMIDPIGFDETNFTPTHKSLQGYAAAWRDAWTAVADEELVNE